MNDNNKQNQNKEKDETEEDLKDNKIDESEKTNQNAEDEKLFDKISKLENDLESIKEEKLRLLAEMENLRKRFEKEKIESIKFGSINLIRDFLSPCDNLLRALDSLTDEEKTDKKNKLLVNGISMVHQEIITILEKNGVKKINALNEKFDHNLHQAMVEIESDEESGTILKELQVGYIMNDRLVRPSMVVVSKKKDPNKDEKNTKN